MPDGLYERDVLGWSERQAQLLRRLAAGERLNEAVDWPNVIEELEAVGRSELRACGSLLQQALTHLVRLHVWSGSPASAHWRGEALGFLDDARDAFSPSMREHLQVVELYAKALRKVKAGADGDGWLRPTAADCPFTLDDLLAERSDVSGLVARLA